MNTQTDHRFAIVHVVLANGKRLDFGRNEKVRFVRYDGADGWGWCETVDYADAIESGDYIARGNRLFRIVRAYAIDAYPAARATILP